MHFYRLFQENLPLFPKLSGDIFSFASDAFNRFTPLTQRNLRLQLKLRSKITLKLGPTDLTV